MTTEEVQVKNIVHTKPQLKIYTASNIELIPQAKKFSADYLFAIKVIAEVLPFRVNQYVIDELINWDNIPDDPIFQLTFPQYEMLSPEDFSSVADMITSKQPKEALNKKVSEIRKKLNPHPGDQIQLNIPMLNESKLEGIQHKYPQTVLFFPSQAQTCHTYCSFCFRWPQFIGESDLKFATKEKDNLLNYLKNNKEILNLLITGGDPFVMKTRHLSYYLEDLIKPEYSHIQTIRIGSKALTYWPFRFVTDDDADDLSRLFEKLIKAGKHIAIMAHYNHPRELENFISTQAIKRIQSTGAIIRSQGPLLAHVNNNFQDWATLWTKQEQLGIIPYYMFIERDTGAHRYYKVPLANAYEIYRQAISKCSGLARTARGPSMSTSPGKIEIQGITEINNQKVFVLRFIQARNESWVQKPFFAEYDSNATWFSELKPAFGQEKFFFED